MERHIVIDARQYSTTSGRYIRELINHLEGIDKINRYTVLLYEQDLEKYQPKSSNFTKLVAPFPQFSFAEQTQLLSLLKKLKPDLVHFAFVQQPLFYFGKKVTTIHDLTTLKFKSNTTNFISYRLLRFLYYIMVRVALAKSKTVIVPTKYVASDVAKISSKQSKKVVVTYEAADQASGKQAVYKDMQGKQFIMYTGRAAPHKNLKLLVDAFKTVKANYPDTHLLFVGGDPNYQQLEKYAEKQGTADIHFAGYVPDPELNWLYANTAGYVFPSLSEGFGLPGLEAMTHGAPVVSSNATCLPELYEDAALYFNPTNSEDLAQKIERVLTDKNFRNQLSARGKKHVKKFSWETMAKQTLEIYQNILDR